ncbi:MAG: hypothetical protein ACD_61C00247G0001 [uncultured bacterium]|nr:MAG: hypothetical protein ACD_61C00247G0001 [uncultured bacterium]
MMAKITGFFILFFGVLMGGCTLLPAREIKTPTTVTPTTQQLVGNDKDSHGCIGSAGYQWCATKEKCLRTWEEPCEATTPSPTVDETSAIKTAIKQALVVKHGESANQLTVRVSKIEGNYSSGGASTSEGGGMWFAAKVNNEWKLVWDGNGNILCQDLTAYPDFPATMIPECYNQVTNKTVIR